MPGNDVGPGRNEAFDVGRGGGGAEADADGALGDDGIDPHRIKHMAAFDLARRAG